MSAADGEPAAARDLFSSPLAAATAPASSSFDTDADADDKVKADEPPVSPQETEEERVRRETAESERLAWEMMREEAANAFRAQMEFFQEASNEMSEEDMEAVRLAMREAGYVVEEDGAAGGVGDGEDGGEPGADAENDDAEDDEGEGESDVDRWDYDRLLALGEQIGDVKVGLMPHVLHRGSLAGGTVT